MRGLYFYNSLIPKSRYLIYGGATTLRGYQENTLLSTQYQIYTMELLYHKISIFQLGCFIDYSSTNIIPFNNNKIGYGVGMTQMHENYIIKLEYALSNLDFKEGKIHIKWTGRF